MEDKRKKPIIELFGEKSPKSEEVIHVL